MQMRENDIMLDETPKSMIDNPTNDNHALSGMTDNNVHLIRIPFQL